VLQAGEDFGKMVLVGEAGFPGDLFQRETAEMQQPAGAVDAFAADKRLRTFLHRAGEQADKRIARHAATIRQQFVVQPGGRIGADVADRLDDAPVESGSERQRWS